MPDEPTIEEQDELDAWHEELADALADQLPELPEGYAYHIRSRTYECDGEIRVIIGAKSKPVDDITIRDNRVPDGDNDGWWVEFFKSD